MTYNVLMGTLNPTHSLTNRWKHIQAWRVCVILGNLVHSMVAHLDAVSSMAVDPSGLYILTGSKSTLILFFYSTNRFYYILNSGFPDETQSLHTLYIK